MKKTELFLIAFLVLLSGCGGSGGEITPLTASWEKAIPHQEIPEGLTSLSAESCGACHQSHYQEWKLSTHAKAWTDQQFQAELKKESSPFMCINCHIPLQNQQEYIVTGLIEGDIYQPVQEINPLFDPELQKEGINCASCHVRENAIIGPTGSKKAPHKTIKDPQFLSESLCISCHNANAVITPTLACTFETGDEWKAGPYFGKKNCISCHMDTVTRSVVPGFPERLSHRHFFAGSGIPKEKGATTVGMNGLSFNSEELQSVYHVNDQIDFTFRVKNEFAGHNVPTGDPERFILIKLQLKNEIDSVLKEEIYRIGEEWEWYPEAKKIADNNMLPVEERTFHLNYEPQTKGKLKLEVVVEKHRLNKASAIYNGLTDDYPLYITIYEKEMIIVVR